MDILTKRKVYKNGKRLIKICEELVHKYESTSYSSCWSDICVHIEQVCKNSKNELKKWNKSYDEYVLIAHWQIYHATYDLLASRKYYYCLPGGAQPMDRAKALSYIYNNVLDWLLENHIISEEEKNTDIKNLYKTINNY